MTFRSNNQKRIRANLLFCNPILRRKVANLARAYTASGKRNEALKLLSNLKKRSNPSYSFGSEIATIYASLGDKDQAMNWLEKAYEERFNPGVLMRPGFDQSRPNQLHRRIPKTK
jgi:tetratricopeptide (TPR) repeat protein